MSTTTGTAPTPVPHRPAGYRAILAGLALALSLAAQGADAAPPADAAWSHDTGG